MKRLMIAILVMLMGSGFLGCQKETAAPPQKEKMGRDYRLPSTEKQRVSPPVEETTPKGENMAISELRVCEPF